MNDKEQKNCPLSKDFKVAAEIYHLTRVEGKEPVTAKDLAKKLDDMGEEEIKNSIQNLEDWIIIEPKAIPVQNNKYIRSLKVSEQSISVIKEMYEDYWRVFRKIK